MVRKFHGQTGLALCRNSYKAPRVAALGYVLSTLPLLLFILDQCTPVPKPVMQITAKRDYLAYAL
jgi:hypothetical protein